MQTNFVSLIIQTTHGSMTTISITLASNVVLIVQPRIIAFRLITVRAGRENQTGLCSILLFLFHFLINFQNFHRFVFIMTVKFHKNKNRFISEKKITWKTKSRDDYLIHQAIFQAQYNFYKIATTIFSLVFICDALRALSKIT